MGGCVSEHGSENTKPWVSNKRISKPVSEINIAKGMVQDSIDA